MITKFISQDIELEAFLTGPAGSGKTTHLKGIIEQLDQMNINYLVVAYTHKAKDILISKLPEGTDVKTLHSFLKKRPGINEKAKHLKALMSNHQVGKPDHLQFLVIDEFSFVGEKDYFSIGELQDELELGEGIKPLKVLYVGDLNQLSPVDGPPAVFPHQPFWEQLTTIYRTSTSISTPLANLVEMIEGTMGMKYLEPTEHFVRKQDIDFLFFNDTSKSKIMLAFTNRSVEQHNSIIQGWLRGNDEAAVEPIKGEDVYNSTLKCVSQVEEVLDKVSIQEQLTTPNGLINHLTKFNPMSYLNKLDYVKFYVMSDGSIIPAIFGNYRNKVKRDELGKALVAANKKGMDSRKIFREYKTINDYVSIIDFNHCMTIHKSQGSEFDFVYVDSNDLGVHRDKHEMLKLLYVAMSRSRNKIYLNN